MHRFFRFGSVPVMLATVLMLGGCSAYRMRVANDFYEQNAFADAIPVYEKVLSRQKNATAMIRLADCLRQTCQPQEAENWYRKVMNVRQQRPIDKLYYAQVLMTNGKYKEAKNWLEIYSHYTRADYRLQKLMESCESLSNIFRDTTRYRVSILKINTGGESNFAPSFYRSGIVFSSDRKATNGKNLRNPWNGKGFTDLYYSKKTERGNWLDPELIRGDVNGNYNDGPASLNKDGSAMFLTRNNYTTISASIEKNKKNFNVLKVFKCVPEGNGWKISGEMPFCSDDYSVGHAVANSAGTAIYFTSDMPWGYGGTDLYVVRWVNGRWGKPQNLGTQINSPGNEMFPFIHNDSILYFSSDGNFGLGGLDIYESIYDGTNWSNPVNLGYPVNTSFDDSGYIVDSLDMEGFFSSNRMGGVDKIYEFTKGLPSLTISGIIYESLNNQPLQGIRVTLKTDGQPDTMITTNPDGRYSFPLRVGTRYTISVSHPDYYATVTSVNTIGKRESGAQSRNFGLAPVILNKPEIWKNISFEKKDWELQQPTYLELDKLAGMLSLNPGLQIEIASYTDSRGNDQENLALTQKRADACYNYLVSKGISWSRMKARGYGETKLLNNCGNGILCLDEEHAENNRIEIRVTVNMKQQP